MEEQVNKTINLTPSYDGYKQMRRLFEENLVRLREDKELLAAIDVDRLVEYSDHGYRDLPERAKDLISDAIDAKADALDESIGTLGESVKEITAYIDQYDVQQDSLWRHKHGGEDA